MMNTDSPNIGAKIQYNLIHSEWQLSKTIRLLSQLAKKYSWRMNITDTLKYNLLYGLKHTYGMVYWCHLDPVNKSIMFSPRNINKNLCIGSCSSPSILALCAELYIVNGCNSNEFVKYDIGTVSELIPEITTDNNFTSSNYISQIYMSSPRYSSDDTIDLFGKVDPSIEYLYVTVDAEAILGLLGFVDLVRRRKTEGILAKRAYIEELLGCNFEEFCKLVPNETLDIKNMHKSSIPGNCYVDKISIGGHVFSWEIFKQHTDIDIRLFNSMLRKVNHSIYISRNANILFQFNDGAWNYYKYVKPTDEEVFKSTIDRAIAYKVKVVGMQQNKVEMKSYNILKEGLTIKIEENEKFN